jgi:hypothetical protein
MKTLLSLIILCSLAMLPLQNMHAEKTSSKFFSIGINVYNAPNYSGAMYVYGPTPFSTTLNPGPSTFGPFTAGNYSINMYTSAPGTHTFTFNSQSIVSSTGSASFTNVNITSTSFASISN